MKLTRPLSYGMALLTAGLAASCSSPSSPAATYSISNGIAPTTLHQQTIRLSFTDALITEEETGIDASGRENRKVLSKDRKAKPGEFGTNNNSIIQLPLYKDKEEGMLLVRYTRTGLYTGKIDTTPINEELLPQFKSEIIPILYSTNREQVDQMMEERNYTGASGVITPLYHLRFTSPVTAVGECEYGDEEYSCRIRNIKVSIIPHATGAPTP